MFGIYLPYPVYEMMPYGYVLFGGLSLIGLDSAVPKLCGLVLVGVGFAIRRMRQQYRRHQYAHPLSAPHAH